MIEMSKHTPAPWNNLPRMACIPVYGQHEAGLSIGFINSSNPDRIAEGKANAYLISAAPDLLEALEVAADKITCQLILLKCDDDFIESELSLIKKAIAKARGEA